MLCVNNLIRNNLADGVLTLAAEAKHIFIYFATKKIIR